ncbi:MAG: lipoyl(octanoyl) transferase [Desulfuromonadales bacterium GWC2_61_20]|nr:MAG: lipoyl(octanoyl) transferase [Desulfuromonadales bacterium GWC2_61_20]
MRPGRLPYDQGIALQEKLLAARPRTPGDILLLLEHPPTVTCGRRAQAEELLVAPPELARRGITVHDSNRGGAVTYHGPGQLVGYPIVDLDALGRDLHRYLRLLEELLIRLLADYGLRGERSPGRTGVWVGREKIAAIGVAVRRWVTWHGFALNLAQADLAGFAVIVPCGLQGVRPTSLEDHLGRAVPRAEVEERLIPLFAEIFGRRYLGSYETDC